ENLFRRDSDGDYWLVDRTDTVMLTPRGPVFTQPIVDVLNDITALQIGNTLLLHPTSPDFALVWGLWAFLLLT
ncbi:hypothetical protein, partial [Nocardia cyriacigeorgica]|uniref:hypothetical protein n=1 Tax=Nocardia cyriacigeorgica TaxID=135487 RepID=UPI0024570F10